jgi:hypothetical protein
MSNVQYLFVKPKRQYDYISEVSIENIHADYSKPVNQGEDPKYRYVLSIPFKKPGPTNEVILMNPSWCDLKKCDRTIYNIQNVMWKHFQGGTIIILNLFACHGRHSGALARALVEQPLDFTVGPKNDEFIVKTLEKADNIFVAWGNPPKEKGIDSKQITKAYDERIDKILSLINNRKILCTGITQDGYPKHGLTWRWNQKDDHGFMEYRKQS